MPMVPMEHPPRLVVVMQASFMATEVMPSPVDVVAMPAGLVMAVWAGQVLLAGLVARVELVACCSAMAVKADKAAPV